MAAPLATNVEWSGRLCARLCGLKVCDVSGLVTQLSQVTRPGHVTPAARTGSGPRKPVCVSLCGVGEGCGHGVPRADSAYYRHECFLGSGGCRAAMVHPQGSKPGSHQYNASDVCRLLLSLCLRLG
ncbi:hypothetical protein NDU88_005178 [Pleurodeles waltl]|uniref:Uncharacterized protein n=1 Tax=Pleurodeles waltl TaxID=8319 RepID=A0AAV7PHD5_PLEWA|nr:hypothetical protein NDU88_005178 [Pleurodeles waltl]